MSNPPILRSPPGCPHPHRSTARPPCAESEAGPGVGGRPAPEGPRAWSFAGCRPALMLTLHGAGYAAIYLLACVFQADGLLTRAEWAAAWATLPVVVGLKLLAVVICRGHRGWWRHATFADFLNLAETATLGSTLLIALAWASPATLPVPLAVFLLDWAGTMLASFGARAASRVVRELLMARHSHRVLVVGADDAGQALAHKLRAMPHLGMRVVGFLDPDPATHGRVLANVPVFGAPGDLRDIARRQRVETVFVPMPAVPARVIRRLREDCEGTGVKVQVVPAFDALLAGHLTVQPREVDIPDLLRRESIHLDNDSIGEFLRGKVVLVTGGAGSIGREICRQVLAFHPERLILVDHAENGLFYFERELKAEADAAGCTLDLCMASIVDEGRVEAVFAEFRPDVVFHAAAHKHVPMMESNPGEAIKNNVRGTLTVARASLASGAEAFVMISTDKAVNPTSVMGATKRLAESVVQSLSGLGSTRFVTVRFGNVLGSTGSVVPIFREQIRLGVPVTVTHPDMTRFFMTIPEAAQLVMQAGAIGRGGEIFVLDMGEPVKVTDLASEMIRLSGLKEGRDLDIVFTGIRPGEKLFEELYSEAEERLPTPHPKIFISQQRPCDPRRFWADLEHLFEQTDRPAEEIIAALNHLVPEYHPNRPGKAATPAPADAEAPQGLLGSDGHRKAAQPRVALASA